ncbi:hypothetical protein J3R30DRAFT_3282297 [Lentinula aciculospora]|uniref:protein-tyrosine-phosphatase n=1 Tax=Lentinula aciculospora TaxID=153920 RepID=A0A9W9DTS0_9AGAR|nr:hypothetical protein J3R30DRAFT_3282297 [Lentinula aciculospora]
MKAKALAPLKPKFPLPSNNLKPSSSFAFIEPIRLSSLINTASAIIIDIRPHAAYSSARIPTALSLSVPSTLLKRPLFSLDRLAAMLPSSSARARFTEWPKFTTIIVYDVDSTGSPFLPEGNNILGLLRKFSNDAAYSGNTLLWLKGGFQRVWREHRDLVDFHPPEPEAEDEANETGSLKTTHLPSKAFGSGTTTRNSLDLSSPRKRLPSRLSLRSNAPRMSDNKPSVTSSIPFNPFFDTIRQNIELTHGVTERIPLRLPKRVRKRIDDLPFEWLREISRRADVKHEDAFSSEGDDSTSSISEIESHPRLLEQGMEALATQFYHIELAEQKRLMGVMKHHSAESGKVRIRSNSAKYTFPYSITAGVEKGAKNRYRHIWPFEHARVRLHLRRLGRDEPKSEEHDDYVNASYVQPLCTTRRYIATQGPLEATFIDFWTLVYQQNVHVIVMLTREIEGSMVKCGPYWKDEVFGPLRLKLILTEGNVDEGKDDDVRRKVGGGDPGVGGFFFSSPSMSDTKRDKKKKGTKNPADAIIKRTFLLSHVGYPDIPPRKVVQFQYLEWPDMNVPDDPRGVLGLIREVDQAVTEAMHLNRQGEAEGQAVNEAIPDNMDAGESLNRYTGIANNAMGRKQSPVLLHCSAGVGRTGGFIAVDAVLDGVRRELRKTKNSSSQHGQSGSITLAKLPDAMDVDINNEEQASALTSSTGTSFSSLQSLPGSAMPNLSTLQVIGGGQPSLHGEGNRVRTWSAPSVRHKQVETGEPGGKHLQGNKVVADTASPFVPSPLVFGDHSRAVEKSPSSFPNFRRDESTLLSHPSRSLSPNHLDAQSVPPNLRPSAGGTDKDKNSGINVVNHPLFTSSDSLAFPTSTWNTTVSESHTDSAETGTNSRPSTSTTKATSLPTYSNHVPVRFQGAGKRDTDHLPFTEGVLTSVSQHRRTDFSYPRVLHNDHSPQALSNLEEPLMEVLQDMREQRMSLCQSLRQYVFVHAAVIEGALMIVDEERERERKEMSMNVDDDALMRWSTVSSFPGPPSMFSPVPSTPSTGKRVASPTELPKTDKKGDQMLFKKPSIKKKQVLRSRSPQNEMS